MYIRKMLAAATASLLVASLIVMPVSAHGHHGRSKTAASTVTPCPVCTIEDCTEEGHHAHDGVTYCGYEHSDEYCDGSCGSCGSCGTTTTSSRSHHGRRHGCH